MTTYIQTVKANLANAAAQAQQTPKAPIQTGANMEQLKKVIGEKLGAPVQSSVQSAAAVAAHANNGSNNGNVQISLNKKVVKIDYIKEGAEAQTVQLKTINGFIAAIMNLFAKFFPSCQAVQLKIDTATVYVKGSLIQANFPNVQKGAFNKDGTTNKAALATSARAHFNS